MQQELAKVQQALGQGNWPAALALLERLLLAQPDDASLHSERGVVLYHLDRRPEALAALDRALELEPQNPYRHSSRAFLRDATGDLAGAIADYQRALELDPDDAVAHNNLGLLEEKLGYRESAQRRFARADELAQRLGYDLASLPPEEPAIGLPLVEAQAETRTEAKAETQRETQQEIGTNNSATAQQPAPKLTAGFVWQTLTSVVRSREARQEFWDFVRGKRQPVDERP
jgi:tetratricopeptide (TPR) repeat protein